MRSLLLVSSLAAASACVGTSLEVDRHHPADPNAPSAPLPEPPQTLRSGFDPAGTAASAPAQQHDHHQHQHQHHPQEHQHDPHQHHQHGQPAPADGGAR